jgi:hypothetical protein
VALVNTVFPFFTFLSRETNFLNNFQKFKNSFPILCTDFVKKNEETIQSRGNYSREDTNEGNTLSTLMQRLTCKSNAAISNESDGPEDISDHHRLEHIEFKVTV